jgi:4-hydroxy-tetrahydrodipicolinate reductase
MLIEGILAQPDLQLVAALDVAGSPAIGQDAAATLGRTSSVVVRADLAAALASCQVLIDFTRPEGTLAALPVCASLGVAAVIGTTGFSPEQKGQIATHAVRIPIVIAPNMSVGVNVMLQLLQMAAASLHPDYDVEIIEAHHRHKVDAPSGTALAMGEAIAQASGRDLKDCAVYARQGHTGERPGGSIGFATIRGGDIVGEHTALFAGSGERIEISHRSSSRANYVEGSLRAARFIASQAPGLYGMDHVLGFRRA